MQYTTKFAFLAAAVATALAAPLAPRDVDYDLEARQVESDLSAREFYDMYLEARADVLDARSLEDMDLEAREYLEYLEAREAAHAAAVQQPLAAAPTHAATAKSTTATVSTHANTPESHATKSRVALDETHSKVAGSKSESTSSEHHSAEHHSHLPVKATHEQKKLLADATVKHAALQNHADPLHKVAVYEHKKKLAKEELKKSPERMHEALTNKHDSLHKLAIKTKLSDPKTLAHALKDKQNPLHKQAKLFVQHKKEKKYLADKHHYDEALRHSHNKFHKAAVRKYLLTGDHMKKALHDKKSKHHKTAVKLYLSDAANFKKALHNKDSPYHKYAERLERHRKHHKKTHHKQSHRKAGHEEKADATKGVQSSKATESSVKGEEGAHSVTASGAVPTATGAKLAAAPVEAAPAATSGAAKLVRRMY